MPNGNARKYSFLNSRSARSLSIFALSAPLIALLFTGTSSAQQSRPEQARHHGYTGWVGIRLTKETKAGKLNGWSGVPFTVPKIGWTNDAGCSGYFTGETPAEMECAASSIDIFRDKIVIRQGFWDGSNGFGRNKALYYHNLDMQPIIDTIRLSATVTGDSRKEYLTIFHYTDGNLDQEVQVVADEAETSFQGVNTPDGKALGMLTAYCLTGGGALEPECPEWVNDTL